MTATFASLKLKSRAVLGYDYYIYIYIKLYITLKYAKQFTPCFYWVDGCNDNIIMRKCYDAILADHARYTHATKTIIFFLLCGYCLFDLMYLLQLVKETSYKN